MSWIEELYKIYERQSGVVDSDSPLLPIAHTTVNAQIELTITEEGEFVTAERVDKEDAVTVIPVTEDSGARSSGIAAHPLMDKLVYIAADYPKYNDGKRSDNKKFYDDYMDGLTRWAESDYSHPTVRAIAKYVSASGVITDLITAKVLECDEETGLLKDSVKIAGIAQCDCFVRFRVLYKNGSEPRTWADRTLQDAFISYYSTKMGEKQLCYALGEELPSTYKHPSKIRNAGDKAKLISTNDESGFTYRGRFADKEQAISVSNEFSQKAHNALKWLVGRQGVHLDSMSLVVWESALNPVPDVTGNLSDAFDIFGFDDDETESGQQDIKQPIVTYKDRLRKSIFGYKNTLEAGSKTMVMALDAATTGRLSMSLYTELSSCDFLDNLEKWHNETAWVRYNGKKKIREVNSFSLADIIECAFGTEQGNFISCKPEIKRDTYLRLIPCVIEGRKFPQDIVNALVNRAINPQMYKEKYNWRKVLEVTCGMIRKNIFDKTEEECSMALDKKCTNRDYLYGRLLAVAEKAERSTYREGEERTTNASRFFNVFANRPASGWQTILSKLKPYLNKMDTKNRKFYTKLIDDITNCFERDDFADNTRLKPEFLHAYSCQLNELYTPKSDKKEEE